MVADQQFSKLDVPLYTGRLVGLRSFAVTPRSELTGVTYTGQWVDGDNQARCAMSDLSFYGEQPLMKDHLEAWLVPEHPVGKIDCTCGYYAYFDNNNNEYQHGINVEGIIEAWGKITIGERGFRASKARIRALVMPMMSPDGLYPRTFRDKLLHRITCKAHWRTGHAWSYPYIAKRDGCTLPLFPYPNQMIEIAARYPSAAIFTSLEEAVEAFPLTSVEVAREIVG